MKYYMDIKLKNEENCINFKTGDYIVIQEKIDGANFSIKYDKDTNNIKAFSRKHELSNELDLRGAYQWSKTLEVNKFKEILSDDFILFGEWLVPHSVKYPKDKYNKAYFYDIFDMVNCCYLPQNEVKRIINLLNLNYVPTFYDGPFISWKHVESFVGRTDLGGKVGEGVVIKNQSKLVNSDGYFYLKIVIDDMREVKKTQSRASSTEKYKLEQEIRSITETIVTKARVEKLLHKLVDENIIPENWNAEHLLIIQKNIGLAIYEDCLKEEPEKLKIIGKVFGKQANSITKDIVKSILDERNYISN